MNSKVSSEGWTFGLFLLSKQWDSERKKERPVSDTALLCDKIQLIVADIYGEEVRNSQRQPLSVIHW